MSKVREKFLAMVEKVNSNKKSAPNFSVQDASAALPQNCQTTKWILKNTPFAVNVTLVINFCADYERRFMKIAKGRAWDVSPVPSFVIPHEKRNLGWCCR